MKINNLIIITNGYPYNNGESFLKPELDYLSKEYDSIIILSINNRHLKIRPIPSNVRVKKIKASLSFAKKIKIFFKILLKLRLYLAIIKNEINTIKAYSGITFGFIHFKAIIHDLFVACRTKIEIQDCLKLSKLNYSNTLLYSYWLNSSATALSFIKKSHPKAKTICRGHGSDIYFEMSPIGIHPFRTLNLKSLDKIYTVSNKGKQYLSSKFGINKDNIITSYLGTYLQNKAQLSINYYKTDITIVSVSRVIELKRVLQIPILLSKQNVIKIRWFHFGDGILFNQLKEISKNCLSLKNNIEYKLMGNVTNSELMKFYSENSIDLFLSLSSSEGIPVSMMEAMSFGIPVVATNVGGVSELVNSKNGFLVNQNIDFKEVNNIFEDYLIKTNKQKDEIRQNAFNFWKNNFNAEKNFPIFAKQLKNLL